MGTCEHPDYPDTGKVVRIDMWRGSLVCPEEDGKSMQLIEFSSFKINGNIPASGVNLFISSYICLSFKVLAEKLIAFRDGDKKVEELKDGIEKTKLMESDIQTHVSTERVLK